MRAILRHSARQDAPPRLRGLPRAVQAVDAARNCNPRKQALGFPKGAVFSRSTACVNCHFVADAESVADGRFGPDLTHLMSRDTIAAGAAPNTPENLRRWIELPDSIKPGSLMPAMGLSQRELRRCRRLSWRRSVRRRRQGHMSTDSIALNPAASRFAAPRRSAARVDHHGRPQAPGYSIFFTRC